MKIYKANCIHESINRKTGELFGRVSAHITAYIISAGVIVYSHWTVEDAIWCISTTVEQSSRKRKISIGENQKSQHEITGAFAPATMRDRRLAEEYQSEGWEDQ